MSHFLLINIFHGYMTVGRESSSESLSVSHGTLRSYSISLSRYFLMKYILIKYLLNVQTIIVPLYCKMFLCLGVVNGSDFICELKMYIDHVETF